MDTKGLFKTTLTTSSGAMKRTWVYVVAGARGTTMPRTWGSSASTPRGAITKELTAT